MKYGMRERVSGAIILIALAVIFVPMLFDDPAPRDERPQPVMSIEQPVPVERRDVPDPQPPGSLGEIRGPESAGEVGTLPEPVDMDAAESDVEAVEETAVVEVPPADVIQPDPAQQAGEPPARDAACRGPHCRPGPCGIRADGQPAGRPCAERHASDSRR
ncbi:hypothetical protein [Halomonas sp. BC04]|uniref:hypothetical protein n=1 Tax=Halomonas sp. BC04 TaxID=1403540 RepID=UPI0003ED7DA7|nr:hypothetical protein Q427_15650 [Halomonas sp. BC04]